MRQARRYLGLALVLAALAVVTGCNGGGTAELQRQLDACNEKLAEQTAALADCEAQLTAEPELPPGGTTIIVDPGGGGANAWTIGSSAAQPTLTGNQLNDRAFGPIRDFKGRVKIGDKEFQRDLLSLSTTFGGHVLTLERSNTTPQVFVWKLDGQPMEMVGGQPESAWNATLCEALSEPIQVVTMKPGGGSEPGTGLRIEIYAHPTP